VICQRIILFFLVLFFSAVRTYSEQTELPPINFEGATPKRVEEAQKIMVEIEGHFQKVFHKKVKPPLVDIQLLETLRGNGMNCSYEGHLEGVTLFTDSTCVIQISTQRTSTWGRILAHEMGHVLIHQAYGQPSNLWLNEGIAEYLAGESFPSEVRTAYRKNASQRLLPIQVIPYVEGLRFCNSHAEDAKFPGFFEVEIKNSVKSVEELVTKWEKFVGSAK
jgi:hypothetical protein